ncbi:hypothetical protein ACOMHN_050912 [Nucella lapillus]
MSVTGDPGFFWDGPIGLCHRPWEKVYAHDHRGNAMFGHAQSLVKAVLSGDVIRVVIDSIPDFKDQTKTTLALQADNVGIRLDQVCMEALSLHNHFNRHFQDHNAQGDTLWNLLLCAGTGNLHVLGVTLGPQRILSDRHVGASATWYAKSWAVRERERWRGTCEGSSGASSANTVGGNLGGGEGGQTLCEKRPASQFWPVYSHFATGVPTGRKPISALLEAVKHGQDVRASMRDRAYVFPMHAVHWSEKEGWVGGHGILHVGQRFFPSHVGMQTRRPYLWMSSWSTTGRRYNSRWALQGHVSQGANQDTAALDWMTDACWRHVYTNDAQGRPVSGSLEELVASVRGCRRVRVVVDGVAAEADVLRVRGGHVAAQLLSQLTPLTTSGDNHHLLHDDPRWNWKLAHTTGTVHKYEVLLSNHTLLSHTPTSSTVSWFVDSRPLTSLLRIANGNVVSGHMTNVSDEVLNGASVRIRIHHTPSNGDTIASASNLKVVTTQSGLKVTSGQILRFLGDQDIGDWEVRLQGQLIWWMTEVDTLGVMSLSAWDTSHKMKYFDITLTPEIDWLVNT